MPRLFDSKVLLKAVRDGIERQDAPFAYSTGKSKPGYHTGIIFRSLGNIYFDENSLLVHPDHLVEPPEVKPPQISQVSEVVSTKFGGQVPTELTYDPATMIAPPQKQLTSYYGRVQIDPQRINKDMGVIVEEVIERLTSQLGCTVEVNLEVNAKKPSGFEESAIRTISENSRTLKFDEFGFEEG